MSVSLKKGQGVSLSKSEYDLSQVVVGLGWDVREEKPGLLKSLFGKKSPEYDLDVVAFLCDKNGKLANLGQQENGRPTLVKGDIIFFNNLMHNSNNAWLTGDNRTGEGDGDDEQIILKLNALDDQYHKIVFIVQIYNATQLQQHFGEVDNAFIRAVDAKGKEMVRFDLSTSQDFQNQRSMVFAELNREANGWQFKAIGKPSTSDTFVSYIEQYIS